MVQPMKISTTGWSSIKSVHDVYQSNSKNCTNRNVLDVFKRVLDHYGAEGDNCLERIFTADETSVADHFSIFGGLLASFASGVWHSL